MSMPALWVHSDPDRFTFEEIKNGNYPEPVSDFSKSALDFCRAWLNGKDTFELETSGSTGTPKKITVTRDQLQASARLSASFLGLEKGFTALVCLDTRYIAGVMMLVRSLEVGMNMILAAPSSNPIEKLGDEVLIDFAAMVPMQLETILTSSHKEKLNQIKIALIGGAALNPKTGIQLASMKCTFYATYGMTETLSHIALQKLNGKNTQEFFQVLPGITIMKDERGCLIINAPHLSKDLLVTNDLVDLAGPSQFRVVGRFDSIINTGGVKVIPEKIESSIRVILEDLHIKSRFFIASLPDDLLGASVNLFFESDPFPKQTEELIQAKLKDTLSRYEKPKSIRYITAFVNTDTGKINRVKTIASLKR